MFPKLFLFISKPLLVGGAESNIPRRVIFSENPFIKKNKNKTNFFYLKIEKLYCKEDKFLNVIEAITYRKSVRHYLDKTVESKKILEIMKAARLAPSAFNKQRARFIIVRDGQTKKRLIENAKIPNFVAKAPVIIVACAKTDSCTMHYGQPCYPIDVAIALDHITLAAVEYGLGSCWISVYDEKKVQEILQIPKEIRVISLMIVGYSADVSSITKKRLPIDEIVKYEKW